MDRGLRNQCRFRVIAIPFKVCQGRISEMKGQELSWQSRILRLFRILVTMGRVLLESQSLYCRGW